MSSVPKFTQSQRDAILNWRNIGDRLIKSRIAVGEDGEWPYINPAEDEEGETIDGCDIALSVSQEMLNDEAPNWVAQVALALYSGSTTTQVKQVFESAVVGSCHSLFHTALSIGLGLGLELGLTMQDVPSEAELEQVKPVRNNVMDMLLAAFERAQTSRDTIKTDD